MVTAGSVLTSSAALGLVRPADASTAWRMRGDAFEACSCNVTCPCNLGSDPTLGFCEVIVAWRIQEGHYGNTRLDGLHLVQYMRMPGNLWQGNWTAGHYLDQRATPEQVQALGTILSGRAGGWFAAQSGLRPFVSAGLGGGQIRHVVTFANLTDCGATGNQKCVDSVPAGPLLAQVGGGVFYRLG